MRNTPLSGQTKIRSTFIPHWKEPYDPPRPRPSLDQRGDRTYYLTPPGKQVVVEVHFGPTSGKDSKTLQSHKGDVLYFDNDIKNRSDKK